MNDVLGRAAYAARVARKVPYVINVINRDEKTAQQLLDRNEALLETIRDLRSQLAENEITIDALRKEIQLASEIGEIVVRPTINQIIKAVSQEFNVRVADIIAARRDHVYTFARHVAFYLSKTLTLHSYGTIGKHIGDRDHTTILNGVNRIQALRKVDALLDRRIASLERVFNAGTTNGTTLDAILLR